MVAISFEASIEERSLSSPSSVYKSLGGTASRLLDEQMQRIRQFAALIGAALAEPSRYFFGNVASQPSVELNPITRTGLVY
jgi:hypothetical protein